MGLRIKPKLKGLPRFSILIFEKQASNLLLLSEGRYRAFISTIAMRTN
jgi:hypothetical protein